MGAAQSAGAIVGTAAGERTVQGKGLNGTRGTEIDEVLSELSHWDRLLYDGFFEKEQKTMRLRTNTPAQAAPATSAEWRTRIAELETEESAAGEILTERRAARRNAAGQVLAVGGDASVLSEMEAAEREAERSVDNLRCGLEFARQELGKLEESEMRAKLEAEAAKRALIQEQILQTAGAIDELLGQVALKLRTVDTQLCDFRIAGGRCARILRGCFMRAELHAGMRDFITTEYVGSQDTIHSLREQLDMTPRAAETLQGS
jgi:hypothetical protein